LSTRARPEGRRHRFGVFNLTHGFPFAELPGLEADIQIDMRRPVPAIFMLSLVGGTFALPAAAQPQAGVEASASTASTGDQTTSDRTTLQEPVDIPTGFLADVTFEASESSPGAFLQLLPRVGYSFGKWNVRFGAPIGSAGAFSTIPTAAAHYGVGDVFLSAAYAVDSPTLNFETAVVGTAPTGDAAAGLGTGQATWNWSNRFAHDFHWLTPFVDAGLGNSVNSVTGVSATVAGLHGARSRVITVPTQPYSTIGKLVRGDVGIDFAVSSMLNLGVLAYDTVPWGSQIAISRIVPSLPTGAGQKSQAPTSRGTKGQRFFEVNSVTQGTASLTRDDGLGASITVSPARALDIGFSYSRSIPLRLDVVSVTVGISLTRAAQKAS
jgi:hypothetical protein